ncbi:potassium uptake protein [Polytolypa hystricis UAMH7299]|uniref:Potassium uptake protein n=1 Tax=Polytolypa hystricis (strain UAMH7299) TaxID=1447883 RepID=A0A2B7YUG5_POLH7|nr:potassium uptake protein [Polytolypa hystricis UAMH7299]
MSQGYVPVDNDDDHDEDEDGSEIVADDAASLLDGRRPLFLDPMNAESSEFEAHNDLSHHGADQSAVGWLMSMWLAYQSIGAIYGDIGTSPLYVFSSTFPTPPTPDDLVGVLSLIIWALTLIATVKYVGIVLCADHNGEGGSFALLSLLNQYVDLNIRDPRTDHSQHGHGKELHLKRINYSIRDILKHSPVAKNAVKLLAVLGVCMVISDGVLTPAQSILGAVQGIKLAAPDVPTNAVVAIACVLIIALFSLQPIGVSRLSNFFAPIVIVWLLFNATSGIYNLINFDATILRAFSPWLGIDFLLRNKYKGWKALGGVLLSFTGVEALFADLGAFSVKQVPIRAIRVSWLGFAFPCLLLTYCGQAAFISRNPDAVTNPLFSSLPPGMYWPTLILSIVTSIVASQAMLTGTFQLISQAIRMAYLPRIRTVHTSRRISSQIYIPLANWSMMIATLIVTCVYKNTTRLGSAYGVCVVGVGFITTCFIALVSTIIWNLHIPLIIPLFVFFALLDCLFLSSALSKVPAGGWFSLALAATLASTLLTWNYGEACLWEAERGEGLSIAPTVFADRDGALFIREGKTDLSVKTIRGIGIFLVRPDSKSASVFDRFLSKFEAAYELSVLLQIKKVLKYHVLPSDRFSVSESGINSVYHVTLRLGYGDSLPLATFEQELLHELSLLISDQTLDNPNDDSFSHLDIAAAVAAASTDDNDTHPDAISLTAHLGTTADKPVTYIVPKARLSIAQGSNRLRRILLSLFITVKNREQAKVTQLKVPVDRLVEIGFSKVV